MSVEPKLQIMFCFTPYGRYEQEIWYDMQQRALDGILLWVLGFIWYAS